MEVLKGAVVSGGGAPETHELEMINSIARGRLTAEEVYCFSLKLCDNEVDRDYERFKEKTLYELAELFRGVPGVFDHNWSARGQTARLFATEVVPEPGRLTAAGDAYAYLKGRAYMLRSGKNAELIAEIEAGIKKEVSVSCAVAESGCSICGSPISDCEHIKGREYGGRLCFAELAGATDAYEWSFVAVPAQKDAGVIKRLGDAEGGLRDFLRQKGASSGQLAEYMALVRNAELGERYMKSLREEVMRLGLMLGDTEAELLSAMTEKLDEAELTALKKGFDRRLDEKYPPLVQLDEAAGPRRFEDETEYQI